MLIAYRKLDGKILFNTGKSFVEPQGISDENGKLAVIERVGGVSEDYSLFRLNDIEDKEKVNEIIQYEGYVSLIFQNDIAVDYIIDYQAYTTDVKVKEKQEKLDSLMPTYDEVLKAEMQIDTIGLLKEVNLI